VRFSYAGISTRTLRGLPPNNFAHSLYTEDTHFFGHFLTDSAPYALTADFKVHFPFSTLLDRRRHRARVIGTALHYQIMPVTGRYRDEDVTDPESVPSSPTSPVERVAPSPAPRWYRRGRARARDQNVKADDVRVRSLGSSSLARRRRRRTRIRVALISLVILMFFGSIAGL
jgi:hypothetical protein